MIYLLDSNICIYLIKNRPIHLQSKFAQFQFGDIGISSITLAELRVGVERNAKRDQADQALQQLLHSLIVADFDTHSALFYGKIRTILEKMGIPIGPLDTLIAAHALSLGVSLVTNNEREFKRVPGLKVENWI